MGQIRARTETSATPEALWTLVRNQAERIRFLPDEGFRDAEGDADHCRFKLRTAHGWTDAESRIVNVVEGREVVEQTTGKGVRYTARFRLEPGVLDSQVDYEISGIPGFVERTVIRPMLQRMFAEGMRDLVGEAERRSAAEPSS